MPFSPSPSTAQAGCCIPAAPSTTPGASQGAGSHRMSGSCSVEFGLFLLLDVYNRLHRPQKHLRKGSNDTVTCIYATAWLVLINNTHWFNKWYNN